MCTSNIVLALLASREEGNQRLEDHALLRHLLALLIH